MFNTDDIMNEVKETNHNTERLLIKIDSLQAQNQLLTNALEKITIRLNSIEQDLVLRD
jgi:vacuolar-type H+-ATPase subunit D/Vma8